MRCPCPCVSRACTARVGGALISSEAWLCGRQAKCWAGKCWALAALEPGAREFQEGPFAEPFASGPVLLLPL